MSGRRSLRKALTAFCKCRKWRLCWDILQKKRLALRVQNEGLPSAVMQQCLLYEYTQFALLRPPSGVVYDYFPGGKRNWDQDAIDALLDRLDEEVFRHHPVAWVCLDGTDYFVRQVITADLKEKGILVFGIKEAFFDYIGNQLTYLDAEEAIVMNEQGEALKGRESDTFAWMQNRSGDVQWVNQTVLYFEEGKNMISAIYSKSSGWMMGVSYSKDVLLAGVNHITVEMAAILALAFFIGFLLVGLLSATITRNTGRIEAGMQEFEKGNFRYRISPASYDEVGLLGLQLNYMAEQIEKLMEIQKADEEKKRRMEIATLQAQINPHFLYNTLGSLKWSAFRAGQRELADSLDALVSLLRFTIKRAAGIVTVQEEINYIKSYIAIEKMRYEDRFSIVYELDSKAMELEIPGFLLQPLVENSLLHGLDMTKEDARIWIRVKLSEQDTVRFLIIEEEDNGIGMTEEECKKILKEEPEKKKKGFSSIGIKIVDRRMREIYGELYHMELQSEQGFGTMTKLWIPLS